MTTEEYIRDLFSGAPLLSLEQLAEVLHRSKDGLRISLSGDNEVSRKFLPCKVRIGRRIYFRIRRCNQGSRAGLTKMSISLIVKRKVASHFTIIPNDVITDQNLSWKSLGLLVKLLSLPPGYPYLTMESLSKKNGTGAAATRSGLQELETAGYLSIERTHDSRGRFAKTVWHISDEPSEKAGSAPYCENPNVDKPKADQPRPKKQAHINTKQTIKPKNKKTTTSLDPAPAAGDPPLRLTALVSAETRSQIFKALEQVAPVDQQRMLNELSAAIRAGSIKTTAIRWFHGVIKRYRDGSYNFKDQSSSWEPASADNEPPRTPTASPKESPSTVKKESRSTVGKEYLKKLKINRSSSGLSQIRILTIEGPDPSSET